MKIKIAAVILIIVFTSLACSFNVNLPKITTNDETIFEINENIPEDQDSSSLTISMGAGKLDVSGGSDQWVTGKIKYNVTLWNPEIQYVSSGIRIYQDTKNQVGIPDEKVINEWNLNLGNHPTDLEINAGAYQGNIDLSGVPVTKLRVSDGASQATIKFNSLNPVEMSSLHYSTGASQISLLGLGNANVDQVIFDGGPGSYTLDFSGDLQRDTDVEINFGLGDVEILIPTGVPANVIVEGGLNNVELEGTWNVSGNEYSLNGNGPQLFIKVKMGLGNLQLVSN
jgi:type 1 fimbria pilin